MLVAEYPRPTTLTEALAWGVRMVDARRAVIPFRDILSGRPMLDIGFLTWNGDLRRCSAWPGTDASIDDVVTMLNVARQTKGPTRYWRALPQPGCFRINISRRITDYRGGLALLEAVGEPCDLSTVDEELEVHALGLTDRTPEGAR